MSELLDAEDFAARLVDWLGEGAMRGLLTWTEIDVVLSLVERELWVRAGRRGGAA